MAYNILPSTEAEVRKAVSFMNKTSAQEAIRLWKDLNKKYGNIISNPLAFDSTKKNDCKIARMIQTEFTIKDIKKELEIKTLRPDFGDGTRGNRGQNNQGTLFERHMEDALNDWIENRDDLSNNKYKDFIYDLVKHYKLDKCNEIKVVSEGRQNKKRPMKLVNDHWEIGTASRTNGYDIGATVTDITLHTKCKNVKRKIYLSLKTSGTTNLSNLGLKTNVFPVDEVKAGKIKKKDGIALMDTFGLNEEYLCATFNEFQDGNRRYHKVENPVYNENLIKELIKGSLGYGYHYVHLQKGTKIKHLEIDKNFLERASTPSNVKISYGGETGGAKRVNIHMTTPVFYMVFNIRNTTDKGSKADPLRVYPDKLQSAYRMQGEVETTKHQGDSTEKADDS